MKITALGSLAALVALLPAHAGLQGSAPRLSTKAQVDPQLLAHLGVVYVDAAAAGAATGHSWQDAFPDLQPALAAAQPGDEIWIAAGTYTPGDAASSFVLRSGVALYGGFAGGERARHERDWRVHEAILSGDIGGDDSIPFAGSFAWFDTWDIGTQNCAHVVISSGVDASAVLDGLTIADGNQVPTGTPPGDLPNHGSGLYNVGGSPTVRNCTFTHNRAHEGSGGALYNLDGSPAIQDCVFVENMAYHGDGGALFEGGAGAALLSGCVFRRNLTYSDTLVPARYGGGMARRSTSPGALVRCSFEDNSCYADFRPLPGYGGGLSNELSSLVLLDCVFTGNSAMFGGGLATFRSIEVVSCLFADNLGLVSDPSVPPIRGGLGAGLFVSSPGPETLLVLDTTIAHNRGRRGVGLVALGQSQALLQNTIVWGNEASDTEWAGTWGAQLAGAFGGTYDCIEELFGAPPPGADPIDPTTMPGCIDADPLFVQPASDLRLAAGSPCIDAGNVFAVPPSVTTDLDGNPRFADDPAVPDTGLGPPPVVDMGAYERQP